MDEKEALSRKILFIIIIIIIFVSILGTWTIISYIDNLEGLTQPQVKNIVVPFPEKTSPTGGATISLRIRDNPNLKTIEEKEAFDK